MTGKTAPTGLDPQIYNKTPEKDIKAVNLLTTSVQDDS